MKQVDIYILMIIDAWAAIVLPGAAVLSALGAPSTTYPF